MKIDRAINICLETEEVETLNEAMDIVEYLTNILEETGNEDTIKFYGMVDVVNRLEDIISDFSKGYPIEVKTL